MLPRKTKQNISRSKYFTKEVNDTQLFLNRTIDNYINIGKQKIINMDHLFPNKI